MDCYFTVTFSRISQVNTRVKAPVKILTLAELASNICKFMIQLGRFDELGSGVRNINKYLPLYSKGAKPIFKETKQLFKLTLPLTNSIETQATDQVNKLLIILNLKPLSAVEIMKKLNLGHKPTFRENYIHPALSDRLIEMTEPDSAKSPTQKYRLTEKGKLFLNEWKIKK